MRKTFEGFVMPTKVLFSIFWGLFWYFLHNRAKGPFRKISF